MRPKFNKEVIPLQQFRPFASIVLIVLLTTLGTIFISAIAIAQLELELSLDKSKYLPSEPIIATAELTNKGTGTVRVFPLEILNNHASLSYEITNPSGQVCEYIGEWAEIDYGEDVLITLNPNQSIQATYDLTQHYSITQLGTYTAEAIYRWNLSDYGEWSGTLESNTVTFEIMQSVAMPQPVKVAVNGEILPTDVVIARGNALISPELFSRLGAKVDLGDKIVIKRKENVITLVTHTHQAKVNGKEVKVDIPPIRMKGRIMVPLRLVAEALGAKVNWHPKTRKITIICS